MKISLNWLNELVEYNATPLELAHRLTMAGLEVEAIDDEAARFENIVVGHVLTRIKHPNADSLSVCTVDVGGGVVNEIVCGAPNVNAGQKVAVALVGAKMGNFIISKRKLRGVVSNGMICSERELGLGESHAGIMVLDPSAEVGRPFAEHYGADITFEIGITPNRADALSHFGVARDVAALFGTELKRPTISLTEDPSPVAQFAEVIIHNSELCPRYTARVISDLKVGPSPTWLVQRLAHVGLRSINNVVDATNLVLMECGHPLHAFDYDKLDGHKVNVRTATAGETFVTLDGKSRTLRDDTLLICDGSRGVAIAGVMGGQNAEISDATTSILIESAYFNPSSIRRTSKFLGLSTDASYRFERGADIDNCIYAVDRVAALIQELAGGTIAAGRIDVYPAQRIAPSIPVSTAKVTSLLGASIPVQQMVDICARLGFKPVKSDDGFEIDVPSWRPDMHEDVDVIEEIARIAGYDKFFPATPFVTMRAPVGGASASADKKNLVREFLVASGFNEIVTNSLIDEPTAATFSSAFVRIANPISGDMAVVRPHPLPQALAAVALNARHGTKNVRMFELAQSYRIANAGAASVDERYAGTEWLTMIIAGSTAGSWDEKSRPADFYDLKGEVERLLHRLPLDNYRFIAYNYDENHDLTAQSAAIEINGRTIGRFGQVSREVLKSYDIDHDVFAAMIEAQPLRQTESKARYLAPPKFPWIERDLAIVAPTEKTSDEIEKIIRKAAASLLLRSIRVFDVFEGASIGEGNRSVAYSLTFGADDRTLRDEEIDAVIKKIVNELEQKHQLHIRA